MDDAVYRDTLKNKKIELINALNLLGTNISTKIKNKNSLINTLNGKVQNSKVDLEYREQKNSEIDGLKSELNSILGDIDDIIKNITTVEK